MKRQEQEQTELLREQSRLSAQQAEQIIRTADQRAAEARQIRNQQELEGDNKRHGELARRDRESQQFVDEMSRLRADRSGQQQLRAAGERLRKIVADLMKSTSEMASNDDETKAPPQEKNAESSSAQKAVGVDSLATKVHSDIESTKGSSNKREDNPQGKSVSREAGINEHRTAKASPPDWSRLYSLVPDPDLQREVTQRGNNWAVHQMGHAAGKLNLDYYPIVVTQMPVVDGKSISPEDYLERLRIGFLRNADPNIEQLAKFRGYLPSDEKLWQSPDPTGAVLRIGLGLPIPFAPNIAVDDGIVLVSEKSSDHWVFSTVRAGTPLIDGGAHPVTGNRAFGFWKRDDGATVFYTAAADRPTRGIDRYVQDLLVFPIQDLLWSRFQRSIAQDINSHGGQAVVGEPRIQRLQTVLGSWPSAEQISGPNP